MNTYQQQLFIDLTTLLVDSDTFFKQEFELDGKLYWIFNYRLSTYTEFLKPSAVECRGIMFEVNSTGKAIRLASLPMSKFWNLNENPNTMDLDLTLVEEIQEKRDGSLISTYLHNGKLKLKSKGSLGSDQAVDAMKWLDLPANHELKKHLIGMAEADYTVNLEWTASWNRIVIGYMEPALTILNARDNKSGEYVDFTMEPYDLMYDWLVKNVEVDDPASFVQSIPTMLEDIEGYVVKLSTGLWFKVKTDKYCSLHHAKDSVNNPRRLFECVLDEGVDDLLSMFATDQLAIKQITEMQERVSHLYNHSVAYVERFYTDNKHLSRKDYAIKGRAEVDPQMFFGLIMNLYLEKENDYKDFFKRHYKELGFKDEKVEIE